MKDQCFIFFLTPISLQTSAFVKHNKNELLEKNETKIKKKNQIANPKCLSLESTDLSNC